MNRLLKILVIFFISSILTIIIYNFYHEEKINILSIGDELGQGKTPFNGYNHSYNYYLRRKKLNISSIEINNLTYDTIHQKIYYDQNIYYKGKYINIKNAIKQNKYLIISANTEISLDKCNKNSRIYTEYLDNIFEKMSKITDQILKIGNVKIIYLTPYCKEYNEEISKYINKYYSYKSTYFINLNDLLNEKYYYLPSKNNPYPSLDGYNKISNEIYKIINENKK